ncbi:MAG: ABC transporter substrate-binding protein [Bacteroidales bacterium]|nr:ABC transporter substrate-binding protein [Bacteroidales bacterium]
MKKIISISLLVLAVLSVCAQPTGERKTVLFLVPFYTHEYQGSVVSSVQSSQDIQAVNSFLLMGFWAGAQIALDEYQEQNVALNVVVKDVTDNEADLREIMENRELMEEVDLIIGPFFNKTFQIAAEYAKQYQIPIVNPFTNRTDILANNDYVYKVIPSQDSKPATLSYMAELIPGSNIILFMDSSAKNAEYTTYIEYFKRNGISYQDVSNQADLMKKITPNRKNIVVVFSSHAAKMLMLSRDLLYKSTPEDIILVVPEKWLSSNTYDVEYYSKLNIHFFSNFYVDKQDQQTQLFIQRYQDKFKSIPTIENFAFQGYDITHFFVEMIRSGGDMDRVKESSICFPISFDKTPDGGYENINIHFLEVKDDEIIPVRF